MDSFVIFFYFSLISYFLPVYTNRTKNGELINNVILLRLVEVLVFRRIIVINYDSQ